MNNVLIIGCGHMGSGLLDLWSKNKLYKFFSNKIIINSNFFLTCEKKYYILIIAPFYFFSQKILNLFLYH